MNNEPCSFCEPTGDGGRECNPDNCPRYARAESDDLYAKGYVEGYADSSSNRAAKVGAPAKGER